MPLFAHISASGCIKHILGGWKVSVRELGCGKERKGSRGRKMQKVCRMSLSRRDRREN